MQAPSTSNSGSSAASQPSRDGDASWLDVLDAVPRGIWLVLAAGVFAAASWLQARQELDPEPLKTRTPAELAWWTYPLETNAAARLPIVTADLGDVFALEDGQHVWAVGDGGIILRTEDGGRTWQRSIARVPASSLERFPSEKQKQEPRNERMKIVVPRDRQGGRDSELVEVGFDFVRVSFLDARNGYVIDELDRILVSSDGGASWVPIV